MKLTVREMTKVAIFPALMVATAGITVPLTATPITLQTLFVLLAGMVLGPRLGSISMTLYIILGAIGLPVFANFKSGLGIILGPSGGFILAFPIAALITGLLSKRDIPITYLSSGLLATAYIYLMGIPIMSYFLGWRIIDTLAYMTIYFPGDLIKLGLAIIISQRLLKSEII